MVGEAADGVFGTALGSVPPPMEVVPPPMWSAEPSMGPEGSLAGM